MIKSYLKIAWRSLLKNKSFSLINIIGLSVSVAICILFFVYIRGEQSFDNFHSKKNQLFRLEITNGETSGKTGKVNSFFSFLRKGDEQDNNLLFSTSIAEEIQHAFPEIKNITCFEDESLLAGAKLIKVNNQLFKEQHVLYADSNFFKIFSFPLVEGSAYSVFSLRNNVVVSESIAKKYFGSLNVLGKTLQLAEDSSELFTISGVAADAPYNSSIQYDLIFPVQSSQGFRNASKQRFADMNYFAIVETDKNQSELLRAKLNEWGKTNFTNEYLGSVFYDSTNNTSSRNIFWYLRPFNECHYNVSVPWGHFSNAKNIYELFCLAIIILIIASLNYVLLTVSNFAKRLQEVGIRKVMGANKFNVILPLIFETQLVILFAITFALILAIIFLPLFNHIVSGYLSLNKFPWINTLSLLFVLDFLLIILTSFYPAFILSRLQPVNCLKSFQTFKLNPRFSRIIVTFQFTICIVLMIGAFVINRQMQFVNHKDLGFNKDQVLIVESPSEDYSLVNTTYNGLQQFSRETPAILNFSGISGGLTGDVSLANEYTLNGEKHWVAQLDVDYNYFNLMGIPIIKGRSFSESMSTDSAKNFIDGSPAPTIVINETLANLLGNEAVVGKYCKSLHSIIIGVVRDYHFASLSNKIQPEEHALARKYFQHYLFKIKKGQIQETIKKIESEWKKITGNYPFEYSFLDEKIVKMYKDQTKWQTIMNASFVFAVIISCFGLFGLSAINAANLKKDIGIRKVLGANVKVILLSLTKKFLLMICLAIIIGIPIGQWVMNNWLSGFAYRIKITWDIFAIAGGLAFLFAFFAMSYYSIRAAIANPVDSLRSV